MFVSSSKQEIRSGLFAFDRRTSLTNQDSDTNSNLAQHKEVAHQKNQYENPSFQPESVFLVLCIRGMGSALWKQKLFVRVKQADSQLRILEENSLALHLN